MRTFGLIVGLVAVVLAFCPVHGQAAAQPESFAVYLSEGAEDQSPVITADDIVSFDWAKQSFVLKTGAEKKLPKVGVMGLKFTAKVGENTVYTGKFVSGISSASIPGPVILVDMPRKANTYEISLDYPGSGFTKDKIDPRWNPIIRESLAKAGKLWAGSAASESKAHCDWLAKTLMQIRTIKPGTTKTEILQLFREDYGLQAVTSPIRYVLRECEDIKIDVAFTPGGVVATVSRPYLEFPAMD